MQFVEHCKKIGAEVHICDLGNCTGDGLGRKQNSNNVDKQMLNQLVNENVIISTQFKILKGQFLLPFFFARLVNSSMLKLVYASRKKN